MNNSIKDILIKEDFSKNDIIKLLTSEGEDRTLLFKRSAEIKEKQVGNRVWFRGLIEFSNICSKNCYYGRFSWLLPYSSHITLSDDEILAAAKFAHDNRYGSIVLQSGEIESDFFTNRIENLLLKIKEFSRGELGITLSVGEQEPEVYRRWYEAGAHRYLLRIEATNQDLYQKIHPGDSKHNFRRRLDCLKHLQDIGYQTGTGVMIGLPYQTMDDLVGDLLFMKDFDIDMCGMGPYIEHADTPLIEHSDRLLPIEKRFDLSLKMIALLRILMKNINIAAATALQAIDPIGREKAIMAGANIIMPNITPGKYRDSYRLYNNKPCTDDSAEDCQNCLETRITLVDSEIVYGEWGDSKHYYERRRQAEG